MAVDLAEITELVLNPSETLSVELKAWIDPRTPAGKAKLLKAMLALRNRNGGKVVIGFDNRSLRPLAITSLDLLDAFHNDDIQSLVSKHASEPFDIEVKLAEREGQKYPVVCVPSGVRTPVAVQSPLMDGTTAIIKKGCVFFRTLNSNGTVSTAEAQPEDWRDIMGICMDNQEADIGRFVRRHLAGLDVPAILGALDSAYSETQAPSLREAAVSYLREGEGYADSAVGGWLRSTLRGKKPSQEELQPLQTVGAWQTAMVIDPPPHDRRSRR